MDRNELIKSYKDFFKSEDHLEIHNSSLIPENDPTVLFTTAGMHPLVPFLLGESHPQGTKLVGVQRCIRTGDIEEVGDSTHHTFFEMLGNWSLGDYFKKEAIELSFQFLTKVLGIPKDKLAVSVFAGDKEQNIEPDIESEKTWLSLGIPKERIAHLGRKDNWWGPAGKTGPCGPDTEMFYWKSRDPVPKNFDPSNDNWVEIWNDVIMGYEKTSDGNFIEAKQKNIDTGMGVERTVAILEGFDDNYLASMWVPIINQIEEISGMSYNDNQKPMRIIADHVKAAVFIIADGITPGNSEQGYVLRRLIRRAIRYGKTLGLENFVSKVAEPVFEIYKDYDLNSKKILKELKKEEDKFLKTLEKGLRVFEKKSSNKNIDGETAFLLYQSYGFPIEMTLELAKEKDISVDENGFKKAHEKHQELSRTAAKGKFEGGLADNSVETTRLHTAAHLLNEALRKVLNPNVTQKGANINAERLRFDFSFDRKLTDEEKQRVEDIVNEEIKKGHEITMQEMTLEEAKEYGAYGAFDSVYKEKDKIKVYTVGDFSKEICGGPHVKNTNEMGTFKIKKQESCGSGVRRIKAILE